MDFPSSELSEISSPAEALRLDNAASKGFRIKRNYPLPRRGKPREAQR